MSLYINSTISPGRGREYHIGHKLPQFLEVYSIQADGDELEAIRGQFSNIPMCSGRVVTWRGEMARFIADNLNL